jgi:predicted nucleic acid-binding Zn ribbon protein
MTGETEESIRDLQRDVASRQYYPRGPQPIAEMVGRLMARKGYAQLESSNQRDEAWRRVVGNVFAEHSRASNIRRGVLQVMVRNSAVLQELTFQKRQLLKEMTAALPQLKIRDIRFRVGAID